MLYHGVADCLGVESFLLFDEKLSTYLYLRASANRHRHAIYYIVDVSKSDARKIENLLKTGKYKEALLLLKQLGMIVPNEHRDSLDLIPCEQEE